MHPLLLLLLLLQSCPTLCDPIDGSLPGSPVPGILQARTLEWVAISFSNAGKWKVKGKSLSHVRLFATPWTAAYQTAPSMGFFQAGVLEWVAIVSLTEGIWKSWMKWRTRHVHVCWKSGELDLCLILLSSISEEWYVNWVLFLSILWKLLITFSPLSECLSRMKIPLVK